MAIIEPLELILAIAGIGVILTTLPYTMAAIEYRDRDNGLAFLLLISGVGVWNLMFVAQLLTTRPIIQVFFLALSVVGAVQSGLGFFLFATTASSTPNYLSRRDLYAVLSILGGLTIVLAITAPLHRFYWSVGPIQASRLHFAVVEPAVGYWLHTGLLVILFGGGMLLFREAHRKNPTNPYSLAYVVAGFATIIAIIGSNFFAPGGLGVGSISAVGLTSVGWLQASRGEPFAWLRGIQR